MPSQGYIDLPVNGTPNPLTTLGDMIYGDVGGVQTRLAVGSEGQVLSVVGGIPAWATVSGTGTVTSAGVITDSSTDSIFANTTHNITGSPVTAAGNMTLTLSVQNKNKILGGPATGSDAAPAFRLLVGADLPLPGASSLGGVFSKAAVSHQFLTAIVAADGSVTSAQPSVSDLSALTVSRALVSDGSGIISVATTTATELGYVHGVQSALQTQLNLLAPLASPTFTGTATLPSGTVSSSAWDTGTSTLTVNGVAFSAKAPLASPAFTTQVTFSGYHMEPSEHDAGNSSTAVTIDLSTGAAQKLTLTGSTTITLTNPVTGGTYIFKILTGTGSFTVTWPATVKWPAGTAPVITATASRMDLVSLYWDGTDYFGTFAQNYTP